MGKRSATTDLLLSALEKALDSGVFLYDFTIFPDRPLYSERTLDKYKIYHIVQRLKNKGWVQTYKNEDKVLIKLTEKGKNRLDLEKALSNKKWDGLYRVVIFDIPEKHRKVRNIFRWRIKEWGFKALQKSVWVSNKNITDPLRRFIDELGISEWVLVIVANDIGIAHKIFDRQKYVQ